MDQGCMKLLVPVIVPKNGIGCGRMPNGNTIHGICLVLGAGVVAVFHGVKVTDRGKWEPQPNVRLGTMHEYERRYGLAFQLARDHVHHMFCMANQVEPKIVWHFFSVR